MKKFTICVCLSSILFFTSCISKKTQIDPSRTPASLSDFFDKLLKGNSILTNKEIAKASSAQLKLKKARVIIDNDASFDSKLQIIESAKYSIKLSYYIFQNDYTSSLLIQKLIDKAQKGVQVYLLVDYLTNLKNMPLFDYLNTAGKGNIHIRFYGKPTSRILRDVAYMSMPCPNTKNPSSKDCADFKWNQLKNLGIDGADENRQTTYFSKLLLTGIYSKNPDLILSGLVAGGGIDFAKYKEGADTTEQDKKDLKEFLELLYQATIKDDFFAKIKVKLALLMYGEKLNPLMNEITGRIPVLQEGSKSGKEWDHLTDYAHHKIIIADDRFFQLGGRNIEDSYHMKSSDLSSKYTFMDTDFWGEISEGGVQLNAAYDRLFNFNPLVADFKQAQSETPTDLILNAKLIKERLTKCLEQKITAQDELIQCAQKQVQSSENYVTTNEAHKKIQKIISENISVYKNNYLPNKKYTDTWKQTKVFDDSLSSEDIKSVNVSYIENLNFNKDSNLEERLFGSVYAAEETNGKYIHSLWYQGLLNACYVANKTNQSKQVILHSAYLLPSAGMIRVLSHMINGQEKCKNLKISLLTNSVLTTDLSPINVLAQYQLKALFRVNDQKRAWYGSATDGNSAELKIYEYKPSSAGKGISLHSKVSILGDDAIIGSANADVRSYYMDTNNGVYLRGAKDFIRDYSHWVTKITSNPDLSTHRTEDFVRLSIEELRNRNLMLVNSYIEGRKKPLKIDTKWINYGLDLLDKTGKKIEEDTLHILSPRMYQIDATTQEEIMRKFDNKFKLF